MSDHVITLYCPCADADGDGCDAEISIPLEYEPGQNGGRSDPSWRGYFYVQQDVPKSCTNGHTLTPEQHAELTKSAEKAAERYEYEPEYTGPDRWEDMD